MPIVARVERMHITTPRLIGVAVRARVLQMWGVVLKYVLWVWLLCVLLLFVMVQELDKAASDLQILIKKKPASALTLAALAQLSDVQLDQKQPQKAIGD